VRLFVAFSPPEDLCRAIASLVAPLSEELPAARWVSADNLHLTLQFLGERSDQEAGRIAASLMPVFAHYDPVSLEVTVGGAFPAEEPRVLWVGLHGPSKLSQLQREVADASGERLIRGRRLRPYRPHVTVARCRGSWDESDVDRLRECLEPLRGRSFMVDHGSLYESVLTPEGARYSIAHQFPFRGAEELG
jgi:2'-5' RNA ligase